MISYVHDRRRAFCQMWGAAPFIWAVIVSPGLQKEQLRVHTTKKALLMYAKASGDLCRASEPGQGHLHLQAESCRNGCHTWSGEHRRPAPDPHPHPASSRFCCAPLGHQMAPARLPPVSARLWEMTLARALLRPNALHDLSHISQTGLGGPHAGVALSC